LLLADVLWGRGLRVAHPDGLLCCPTPPLSDMQEDKLRGDSITDSDQDDDSERQMVRLRAAGVA
jgi:hypothetical protein